MVKTDNSAGRLHKLLDQARRRGLSENVRGVWAGVLKVESESHQEFLSRYSALLDLLGEAESDIKKIEDLNHDLFLRDLPSIETALDPKWFTANWQQPMTHLTDAVMTSLAFCAEELAKRHTENPLKDKDLSAITKEIGTLLERVLKADIPGELRNYIVDKLEEIRRSIIEYRIRGAKGLRVAIEATVGGTYFRQEEFLEHKDKPEVSGFWDVVGKVDKLSAAALKIQALVGAIIKSLPM